MPPKKRKVLFVIVEGDSDSYFFFDELVRISKDEHILIKAYDGDIFTDFDKGHLPIRDRIRDFFVSRMEELKVTDFLGIVHFTDTDGSFVSDAKIIVDPQQQEKKLYKVNGIFVNSVEQQNKMKLRNQQKKEHTTNARFLGTITYKGISVPYRLFYLSQNLEHIVFDELNIPGDEKIMKLARFFKAQGPQYTIENLLKNHFPQIPAEIVNKHIESWHYVYQDDNSLQRYTNASLMYEYIDELLSR